MKYYFFKKRLILLVISILLTVLSIISLFVDGIATIPIIYGLVFGGASVFLVKQGISHHLEKKKTKNNDNSISDINKPKEKNLSKEELYLLKQYLLSDRKKENTKQKTLSRKK